MLDNLYVIERKILYNELRPLFDSLVSVRYAVIKGEVLSQQIYGVPDKRRSSDIDILIEKSNVGMLEKQLKTLGFFQQLPQNESEIRRNRVICLAYSHQIPSYHKNLCGFQLNVDINHDIFWGEYEGEKCYIDDFLNDTENINIYGVSLKSLSIEKTFVQVVLHHYKEMNSIYILSQRNSICTRMFRDLYDFLKIKSDTLTVNKVKNLSIQYNIGSYIYYLLYYTNMIFKDEFLNNYLSALECYHNNDLLNSVGLNSLERRRWNNQFLERLDATDISKSLLELLDNNDKKKIMLNHEIFT